MRHQTAAMPEASVIICAHNPRKDYFCRVIEALRLSIAFRDKMGVPAGR